MEFRIFTKLLTNPKGGCFCYCFLVKTMLPVQRFRISKKEKMRIGPKIAKDISPILNLITILLSFTSCFRSTVMSKPVYHDLWGYSVNWTDPRDGWDQARNSEYLDRKAV